MVIKPEPHGYHGDAGALSQATQITKHGVSAAALFLGRMLFGEGEAYQGEKIKQTQQRFKADLMISLNYMSKYLAPPLFEENSQIMISFHALSNMCREKKIATGQFFQQYTDAIADANRLLGNGGMPWVIHELKKNDPGATWAELLFCLDQYHEEKKRRNIVVYCWKQCLEQHISA